MSEQYIDPDKPCPKHGISPRYRSTNICVQCGKGYSKALSTEKRREYRQRNLQKHPRPSLIALRTSILEEQLTWHQSRLAADPEEHGKQAARIQAALAHKVGDKWDKAHWDNVIEQYEQLQVVDKLRR